MVSGTITISERDFFEREFKLPEFGRGGTLTPSSSRRKACLSVAADTFEAWGANLEELAKAALPGRDDAFQLVDPGNLRAVLREGSHEVLFLTSSTHCYFDNIERLGRGWLCGRHCAGVEVRELPDLTGGPLRPGGARELTVVGEFIKRVGCFPLTGSAADVVEAFGSRQNVRNVLQQLFFNMFHNSCAHGIVGCGQYAYLVRVAGGSDHDPARFQISDPVYTGAAGYSRVVAWFVGVEAKQRLSNWEKLTWRTRPKFDEPKKRERDEDEDCDKAGAQKRTGASPKRARGGAAGSTKGES